MGWGAFLAAAVGPLAKRVLISLGVGVVTYAAVVAALKTALDAAKATIGGAAPDVVAILAIGGFWTAFAIIAGGMTAAIAVQATSTLGLTK